jgi:hypothetical protein
MSHEPECSTYSYDEALQFAKFEAKRIIQANRTAIRYVKYEDFFKDYCQVNFDFAAANRSSMMMQMLPLDQRQADELLTDDHIMSVARDGHFLDAIRLYRLLHSADLATAKRAIEDLIKGV